MKRITYISKIAEPLTDAQVHDIGTISACNNQALGVTGVLVSTAGIFFQIIEGEELAVDPLYRKIVLDPRHADIFCLNTEYVTERLFPDWAMQVVNLDTDEDVLIRPFRALLQHLGQTHQIIQKYTQPAVTRRLETGLNPLSISPHASHKIILFSDIVGFSKLSERLPVAQVAELVNRFLEICSVCVDEHGGEVTKYIGDCVMALFDPDQADQALHGSLAILRQLAGLRATAQQDEPFALLHGGIGLAAGMVLEGNLGSSVKMDYTVLGDAVNTASRLESLTRSLGIPLLFSAAVKECCQEDWPFHYVGTQTLKGKEDRVEVLSLRHPLVG